MARLIDAEALYSELRKAFAWKDLSEEQITIYEAIEAAPTVDAEPVRRGHYVDIGGEGVFMGVHSYECSECGGRYSLVFANMKYCSYCGSRMGGVGK